MKKKIIFLGVVGIGITITLFVKPVLEDFWSRFRDFTNPNYSQILEKRWINKSTDFLLEKINHPSIAYSGVATTLLRQRTDSSKINRLERIIDQHGNARGSGLALSILFVWDKNAAINKSIKIIGQGKSHPLFSDAMSMLTYRKYEPVFPYLIKMAQEPDGYRNGSVNMLKEFGRPEAIPILEDMIKKVDEKDPMVQRILKSTIQEAIRSIKEQNNIK